ncbi:MAG: hypothetical protein RLY71_1927 [Pseudomonadota bacterium]
MLAAQCVGTVLRTEHAMMREALSVIGALTANRSRHQVSVLERLCTLLDFLRRFGQLRHHPKDACLLAMMQGRCAETDRLLEDVEQRRQQQLDLLSACLDLLTASGTADPVLAVGLIGLLQPLRSGWLEHLRIEESELMPRAWQLLGEDDWARLASDISALTYPIDLVAAPPAMWAGRGDVIAAGAARLPMQGRPHRTRHQGIVATIAR